MCSQSTQTNFIEDSFHSPCIIHDHILIDRNIAMLYAGRWCDWCILKGSECVRSYAGFRNNVAWNVHDYWLLLVIAYYCSAWLNGRMESTSWFMTKYFIACMFIVINSLPRRGLCIQYVFYRTIVLYIAPCSKTDISIYLCTPVTKRKA